MADAQRRTDMTVEEFLEWNLSQDQRYEFVDGVPVPLGAMAGAKDEHDTIVVNLIIALGSQLAGTPCRPKKADTAARTRIKRVRRPDVTIECAPVERGSLEARNPIAVFEVLSPTTRQLDRSEKLDEYIHHPSLRAIVHIDPGIMDVMVYTRTANGQWQAARLDQPEGVVRIPDLPVSLSLASVYDGVPLASAPASANDDQDIAQ